jgi:hypothetical protein
VSCVQTPPRHTSAVHGLPSSGHPAWTSSGIAAHASVVVVVEETVVTVVLVDGFVDVVVVDGTGSVVVVGFPDDVVVELVGVIVLGACDDVVVVVVDGSSSVVEGEAVVVVCETKVVDVVVVGAGSSVPFPRRISRPGLSVVPPMNLAISATLALFCLRRTTLNDCSVAVATPVGAPHRIVARVAARAAKAASPAAFVSSSSLRFLLPLATYVPASSDPSRPSVHLGGSSSRSVAGTCATLRPQPFSFTSSRACITT